MFPSIVTDFGSILCELRTQGYKDYVVSMKLCKPDNLGLFGKKSIAKCCSMCLKRITSN